MTQRENIWICDKVWTRAKERAEHTDRIPFGEVYRKLVDGYHDPTRDDAIDIDPREIADRSPDRGRHVAHVDPIPWAAAVARARADHDIAKGRMLECLLTRYVRGHFRIPRDNLTRGNPGTYRAARPRIPPRAAQQDDGQEPAVTLELKRPWISHTVWKGAAERAESVDDMAFTVAYGLLVRGYAAGDLEIPKEAVPGAEKDRMLHSVHVVGDEWEAAEQRGMADLGLPPGGRHRAGRALEQLLHGYATGAITLPDYGPQPERLMPPKPISEGQVEYRHEVWLPPALWQAASQKAADENRKGMNEVYLPLMRQFIGKDTELNVAATGNRRQQTIAVDENTWKRACTRLHAEHGTALVPSRMIEALLLAFHDKRGDLPGVGAGAPSATQGPGRSVSVWEHVWRLAALHVPLEADLHAIGGQLVRAYADRLIDFDPQNIGLRRAHAIFTMHGEWEQAVERARGRGISGSRILETLLIGYITGEGPAPERLPETVREVQRRRRNLENTGETTPSTKSGRGPKNRKTTA